MALNEDQIKQQVDVLATKTSENPEMVYKTMAALNKALNPELFSGNDTKIVNAINKIATELNSVKTLVNDMVNKMNSVMLDINGEENKEIWEETQQLMGNETLIEGIKHLLEGNLQSKILGLKIEDEGKTITIAKDEDGNPILKAVDDIINEGGSGSTVIGDVNVYDILYTNKLDPKINSVGEALDILMEEKDIGAYDIAYTNKIDPEINNIGSAIDGILEKINDSGALSVLWEHIEGKPAIPEGLALEDEALVLISDEGEDMSYVPLTTDEDIEAIVSSLDN